MNVEIDKPWLIDNLPAIIAKVEKAIANEKEECIQTIMKGYVNSGFFRSTTITFTREEAEELFENNTDVFSRFYFTIREAKEKYSKWLSNIKKLYESVTREESSRYTLSVEYHTALLSWLK